MCGSVVSERSRDLAACWYRCWYRPPRACAPRSAGDVCHDRTSTRQASASETVSTTPHMPLPARLGRRPRPAAGLPSALTPSSPSLVGAGRSTSGHCLDEHHLAEPIGRTGPRWTAAPSASQITSRARSSFGRANGRRPCRSPLPGRPAPGSGSRCTSARRSCRR